MRKIQNCHNKCNLYKHGIIQSEQKMGPLRSSNSEYFNQRIQDAGKSMITHNFPFSTKNHYSASNI